MSHVIRYHRYGGPEVLRVEHEDVPKPSGSEVLLRQDALGVNYIDTLQRRGIYPTELPAVPGLEGAGVVVAVGPGVRGFAVGDRVAYFLAPGAYRAHARVDASALVRLPADVATGTAAALLTKGLTAWVGLNAFHRLEAGQTVLVQGASSAVGGLLARWAKRRGARVIGTVGTAGKAALLEGQIDHVLFSGEADLTGRIRRLAPEGVDVAYEFVGKATFEATAASVRAGGTVVNIGAASGASTMDADGLAARAIRVTGGPMAIELTGQVERATADVFAAWRAGVFGELRISRFPLLAAAAAHASLEDRTRSGSVILLP